MSNNPIKNIEAAQAVAQSGATDLVAREQAHILDTLVQEHRAHRLTDRDAAIGIATISALRTVAATMQRAILRGVSEGEHLTSGEHNV